MDQITDRSNLRALYGAVDTLAEVKVLQKLDKYCRDFIGISPFLVLASTDAAGNVDASPRGDAPGFVAILNDSTLLVPDRPGNRRVDSYSNILASPGVGLLFFVPGLPETLRVNGIARIVTDAELLAPLAVQQKPPKAGVMIDVQEAFFHCGKALIRSKLWDGGAQISRGDFPKLGTIIADQTRAMEAAAADSLVEEAYRSNLY